MVRKVLIDMCPTPRRLGLTAGFVGTRTTLCSHTRPNHCITSQQIDLVSLKKLLGGVLRITTQRPFIATTGGGGRAMGINSVKPRDGNLIPFPAARESCPPRREANEVKFLLERPAGAVSWTHTHVCFIASPRICCPVGTAPSLERHEIGSHFAVSRNGPGNYSIIQWP